MPDIPRGAIFGRRVGDPPKVDAEHFGVRPAMGGSIAAISAKSSRTTVRCRIRRRINCSDGRSLRNSNRRQAAQLPRPQALREWRLRGSAGLEKYFQSTGPGRNLFNGRTSRD
jgi:hypothetical protein